MSLTFPSVFDGNAYTRRLRTASRQIYQSLTPLSTVSITLPSEEQIDLQDFVKVPAPDGTAEIYRVSSVAVDAVSSEKNVYLEHAACTLGDYIIPEDTEKKDTVSNVVSYILSLQSKWVKGSIQCSSRIVAQIGGMTLLDALTSIMDQIPGYQMMFTATETEWRVDVIQRPTQPLCEARLSRNMRTCEISYSVQDLCTRVYCEGIPNGRLDSQNISVYGVHEETMTLDDSLTSAEKLAIVTSYLQQHDHPLVSISISGLELSQATGLSIDKFTLGAICRVPLPKFGITVDEVIVDKSYNDPDNSPEDITFTLANAKPDLSIVVARTSKSGKSSKKTYIKEHNRWRTKFEQTDRYFMLIATDSEWEQMEDQWVEHVTAYSQIIQTAGNIQSVVSQTGVTTKRFDPTKEYNAGDRVLYTDGKTYRFIQNHAAGPWNTDDVEIMPSYYSQIDQNAKSVSLVVEEKNGQLVVNAASIVAGINHQDKTSSSYVDISADKINLTGYVTTTALDTRLLYVDQLFAQAGYAGTLYLTGNTGISANGAINARSVSAGTVSASTLKLISGEDETTVNHKAVTIGGQGVANLGLLGTGSAGTLAIPDAIASIAVDDNPPSGKIGFKYTTFSNSTPVAVNFNIADTAKYKADVGIASVSAAGWTNDGEGGGYYNTVTATPKAGSASTETVVLPTITVDTTLGTNASTALTAYGPTVGTTKYPVSASTTVYLKADNDYCYITSTDSTPTSGTNILARITNPKPGGSGTITSITNGTLSYDDYEYKLYVPVTASGTNVSSLTQTLSFGTSTSTSGWTNNDTRNTVTVKVDGVTVGTATVSAPSVDVSLANADSTTVSNYWTTWHAGHQYRVRLTRGSTTVWNRYIKVTT